MPIELIPAVATHGLRQTVLRPEQPHAELDFAGDQASSTFHLGLYENDFLVGIISLYHQTTAKLALEENVWQLRGMAIAIEFQGKGYGKKLVQAALAEISSRSGQIVWCNARESALTFYQKLGFQILGERYDMPVTGAHFFM